MGIERKDKMEQVMTVKRLAERYGCSLPTARKYIRQMIPHMENPLSATMDAFRDWEAKRTVFPPEYSRKMRQEIMKRHTERIIVPRHR